MKILIITPRIPYPPFRGDKLKIYNLAKNLSVNNSVKILTFLRSSRQLKDLKSFKKYGIEIEAVKLSVFESFFKVFISLFTEFPFQAAWFQSSRMKKKIEKIAVDGSVDVMYFHLIRSAQYFPGENFSKPVKVIDFTDAVSLYLKRFAEIERNPLKKFFVKVEQKRIERYEKVAERFHTLFICSEVDKEYLVKSGLKANIKILSNGIDVGYFKSERKQYNRNRIIFTGNMPYYANYDAAIYFTKEIFPLILEKVPGAEFFIVGQKPPRRIKSLQSKNVFVTGFVPDIKSEYLNSAVNVAPMRFGAGTLNKVIESIALGVPVVATPMAVGGLPEELNKYIFIADNPVNFADAVVKIINNPSIRGDLMEEGKTVIKNMLSWEKIVADFESYLLSEINI